MKRRVLAGLLASVLALGTLAGCGGGGSEDAAATDSSTEETAEATDDAAAEEGSDAEVSGDLGEVTMILALRDEFLSTLEAGALEAAEELGIRVIPALSLPGRVAPKTAGEIIKETIYHMMEE